LKLVLSARRSSAGEPEELGADPAAGDLGLVGVGVALDHYAELVRVDERVLDVEQVGLDVRWEDPAAV